VAPVEKLSVNLNGRAGEAEGRWLGYLMKKPYGILGFTYFKNITLVIFAIILIVVNQSLLSEEIGPIHSVSFCPNGKHFLTGNQDGTARLWDIYTGKEIQIYILPYSAIVSVAVSNDGKLIAAAWVYYEQPNTGIAIFELKTSKLLKKMLGHDYRITDIEFTPDDSHLVSSSGDDTIRVWNIADGKEILKINQHDADVNSIAISPSGNFILSASGDYSGGKINHPSVKMWNFKDGSLYHNFKGHTQPVFDVEFSKDGKIFASVSDKSIRIWDIESRKILRIIKGDGFSSISINASGNTLISGELMIKSPVIQLWEINTGVEIMSFPSPGTHDIEISPNGGLAVSVHGIHRGRRKPRYNLGYIKDGVAIVWDLQSQREKLRVGNKRDSNRTARKRRNINNEN